MTSFFTPSSTVPAISTTPSSQPAQTSQATNLSSFGPVYLYAFAGIAVVVVLFVSCAAWRGLVIRRRRRELGLPEIIGPAGYGRPPEPERPVPPPILHEVYISTLVAPELTYGSAKERAWTTTMPVASSLVREGINDVRQTSQAQAHPDVGVTYLHVVLAPFIWPFRSLRRRFAKKSPAVSADEPPPYTPEPERFATLVMIAMPTERTNPHGDLDTLSLAEEGRIPDILFGVHEGPWVIPIEGRQPASATSS